MGEETNTESLRFQPYGLGNENVWHRKQIALETHFVRSTEPNLVEWIGVLAPWPSWSYPCSIGIFRLWIDDWLWPNCHSGFDIFQNWKSPTRHDWNIRQKIFTISSCQCFVIVANRSNFRAVKVVWNWWFLCLWRCIFEAVKRKDSCAVIKFGRLLWSRVPF